jgi:2-phospho-L-lactate guanylyltransferase
MTNAGAAPWCLVVPVKRLAVAKTRLAPLAGSHRRDLALAFALDTTAAAVACADVQAVVVVTDEPDAARLLRDEGALVVADEPDAGLNPALVHGAAATAGTYPGCAVGALSADLPALRPTELAQALDLAPSDTAAFVRDAEGSGTTALLARRRRDFVPAFGPGSATAHQRSGAVELVDDSFPSVRRDVDTPSDLEHALAMGVGPRTAEVVSRFMRADAR